jgi:hypothetical protein
LDQGENDYRYNQETHDLKPGRVARFPLIDWSALPALAKLILH